MPDPATEITDVLSDPAPRAPKGYPIVAWIVVAIVVAFVLVRNADREGQARKEFDIVLLELQCRYLVGIADLLGQRNPALLKQAETLDHAGYEQLICFAVVAGELAGPEEALQRLRELPNDPDADTKTAAALKKIYQTIARARKEEAPVELPSEAAERVREKLGWFGELATAPPGASDAAERAKALVPARRTALLILAAASLSLLGAVAGLVVLVVVFGLTWNGTLHPQMVTGSPYGGIYAETFAAWMVLFIALGFAGSLIPSGESKYLVAGLLMLSSLSALAWPVARGVPWRAVRYDVGLAAGRRPAVEILAGGATYLTALPMLVGGILVTVILAALAKRLGVQSEILGHPLAPFLIKAGWWGRIQALLVASIVAPIVEETMFRGVLYRHLREGTATFGKVASVVLSAPAVSFVFAVIHPQGWLGVPPLMGLAFAFCLARELRGTLLPPMIAHALQNTAVTMLVIFAAS